MPQRRPWSKTAGEAMAPAALSAGACRRRARRKDLLQDQMPTRPDAAPHGTRRAAPAPPAPLLQRPSMLAPAPKDVAARDDRKAREAPDEIDRPLRRPADAPIGAIPDPIVPAAAHRAEEAPAADDEAPAPLRRIQPLLPPQQGLNGTALVQGRVGVPQAPPGGRPSRKPPRSMSASGASRSRRCMKRRRRRSGRRPAANVP